VHSPQATTELPISFKTFINDVSGGGSVFFLVYQTKLQIAPQREQEGAIVLDRVAWCCKAISCKDEADGVALWAIICSASLIVSCPLEMASIRD
jgi:hypothetical protein